jgi:hypothetical protein
MASTHVGANDPQRARATAHRRTCRVVSPAPAMHAGCWDPQGTELAPP